MSYLNSRYRRSAFQKVKDFLTLPFRALTIFEENKWGFSSNRHERFEYAAEEVVGYCLDIGCGKRNLFIAEYLSGHGKGVDVFRYEGLRDDVLLKDQTRLPFPDATFDSVTYIASFNHVPRSIRDIQLKEARRVLRPGGNIIITMPFAFASILIHKIVATHDRIFGTQYDLDTIRGMDPEEEDYYLTDAEIRERLLKAGFTNLQKKYFGTQWGLNHLFVGWKHSRYAGAPFSHF